MALKVVRYQEEDRNCWDDLVRKARNGLFLFERNYMDYHADRFEDCSAIIFDGSTPVALLPASIDEQGKVSSHGGLTFGGLIVSPAVRSNTIFDVVDELLASLRDWGGTSLEVRVIPPWFCSYPSQELEYALWRRGFELGRRDLSSLLPLAGSIPLSGSRSGNIKRARVSGVEMAAGPMTEFHELLRQVLESRHGVPPVHSLSELQLLQSRFPDQVLLRTAHSNGRMLAGTIIYRYPTAWHTQYLANSDEGRELGALDLLIVEVIQEAREAGADYLSFGTSTTCAGRELNTGLLFQKESFGARSIVHDFWSGPLL